MSTLLEYTPLAVLSGEKNESWKNPSLAEQYGGQDEFERYVSLNIYNNGAMLPLVNNISDNYGNVLNVKNEGWYTDNIDAFNVSSGDFTLRIQFGVRPVYADFNLKDEFLIPIFMLGNNPISDSPFSIAMTNPTVGNTVSKGDFRFRVKDTAGNLAYCYLSANDWHMSTYAQIMHFEFSRRGQVFTLRHVGLYGQKTVTNTFPSFGAVDLSGITRAHILTTDTFGTLSSVLSGLQVTKGFCRTVGNNCQGAYDVPTRYANSPVVKSRRSSDFLLHPLSGPVMGLERMNSGSGEAVACIEVDAGGDVEKYANADIAVPIAVSGLGKTIETDQYISSVVALFNAEDCASSTFTTDAKGNSINWTANYNYNNVSSSSAEIIVVDTKKAVDFLAPNAAQYPNVIRAGVFATTPSSVNLSGNYTLECIVRINGAAELACDWLAFGSYWIGRDSGAIRAFWNADGISVAPAGGMSSIINTQAYIAVTRSSNVLKVYLNGVELASKTMSYNLSGALRIGDYGSFSTFDNLYALRITPGVVRTITARPDTTFPTS